MNQSNRRHFLSTMALGSVAGIAGCAGGDNTTRDSADENRDPDDDMTGREEGEISDVVSDITSDTGDLEFSFDLEGNEFQETVNLVIQAAPQHMASPEVDSSDVDAKTLDTIPIVEEDDDYPPRSVEVDMKDYWDDLPGINEFGFLVQAGIELESREEINVMEVVKRGFLAYTHRENGTEEETIYSVGRNHNWIEDGQHHFVMIFSLSRSSNMYDLENYVEAIPVIVKYSVDLDTMSDLEEIHENDPLAWQDLLETRSWGDLDNVEYLDRPIFSEIAEVIEDLYNRLNATEDDDLYVRSAYSMINATTSYDQPWDTVEESIAVPYPELFFRDGEGDCKAQGFAVNGILHHLGYDTSLFLFRHDDAPPQGFHHLSGGVGMDLDPETSSLGERMEGDDTRRHPEFTETDERSAEHVSIDPSTNSLVEYSTGQTAATYHFVEGK